MSNPVQVAEDMPGSPDYLETPTKGRGVRRLNRIPAMIGLSLMAAGVSAVSYTYYERSLEAQRAASNASTEVTKVSSVAIPPVNRPAGPDVSLPYEAPVEAGQGYPVAQGYPMPQDEAEKQARARKAAALEAALAAPAEVEKFGMKQQWQPSAGAVRPSHGGTPGMPGVDGLIPPPPRDDPGGENYGAGDPNQQAQKQAFLNASNNTGIYLKHTRQAPLAPTQLNAGAIIPGVMLSGVNSDLPGQIVGQVRENVYDSASGRILIIPAGARLVGTYDSQVSAGQERVLVAWNRVMFPDGSSLSLDGMPGADQSGFAGFNDKVDNHYWRTFGNAFMLSLFSAGIQLSQPRGAVTGTYNSQQIMAAALGQQLGMLGMQVARRNLSIQPTLEIRPGYLFDIMITKDIILPPWTGHPLQQLRSVQGAGTETDTSGSYQQGY